MSKEIWSLPGHRGVKMPSYRLGELVISTAGRDKGNKYLVIKQIDDKYVELADGDKRRLSRTKRKNIKHIKKTGYVAKELAKWFEEGKRVRDQDLKRVVTDYEQNEEA